MSLASVLVFAVLAGPAPGVDQVVSSHSTVLTPVTAAPGFSRALRTEASTEMVGFDWQGAREGAVALRTLRDGRWSHWTTLEGNPGEGPDRAPGSRPSRTAAGPAWIGRGVEKVEVKVGEGRLPRLRAHLLGSSPTRQPAWGTSTALADPASPEIFRRSQWGADEGLRSCAPDSADRVNWAVVHHTVNANHYSMSDVPALLRGMYAFHTRVNGWCDLGYNFLVDRFGRVWEGRSGGIDRAPVGAHASGFNTGSTGVALIGTFSSEAVPPPSYDGLRRLLAWKLAEGVDARRRITVVAGPSGGAARYPPGTSVPVWTISGHRDVVNTECPGDLAEGLLERLRADVQGDIMNSVPYPARGWSPDRGRPALLALDAHGGLHPAGGQPAVRHSRHWPNSSMARGAVRDGPGGYVVTGDGALHPFGAAPPVVAVPSLLGRDVARGVARGPRPGSGWVLDRSGRLQPYGGAPPVLNGPVFGTADLARGVATGPAGTGGYVVDASGAVHAFGTALPVVPSVTWPGADAARAIALRPNGVSGYVLHASGTVHPFGGAPPQKVPVSWSGRDMARGLLLTGDGNGGWVLDADGGITSFGSAPPVRAHLTWTGTGLSRALV